MKNPDVREGTEFPATVVFVVIDGLKGCTDAPKIPNALRALNEALRDVDPDAFVLSTLAGLIVLVPDTVAWNADDTLHALDQANVGFALRVGVTHGIVEVVRDIDDEPNLIGPPINIAARLATSRDNPGVLVHESYTGLVDGTLSATHWLHGSVRKEIPIAGKPQDPIFNCFTGPHRFEAKPLADEEAYAPKPTVLIAYDLPKFSAGDRAQLRKRFTRLAHVFQKLRQSAPMQAATALLSPGGDGGVLVLEGVNLPDGAAIASRLQALAEIESRDHKEDIAVALRIGVHYGPVIHYVNARGIRRPTGLAVFVADEIAGDEHARSRQGVILTHLLADSLAGGSRQQLDSEFEKLPKLTSGPASGLDRFVKADASSRHMLPEGGDPKPQPARENPGTRPDLLKRLSGLLPSQFEEVLFRASVPTAHRPGDGSAPTTRAIAAIRYLEQQHQLDRLGPDPRGDRGPFVAPPASPPQAGLIDFTAERRRHVRFIGRDDVMARLDEWLLDAKDTRWVFVTGGPGMGKSAILAAWVARREAAGSATPGPAGPIATALVPHHFIRRQVADWDQPEVIAGSLAAQIEAAFPALRDANARPQSRLLDLLGRLSKQLDATRPLVVVVDGLDETRAEFGVNPLPRFLPHVVPPGIRFLCATRATYPHLRWIEQRSPVRWLDLDSPQWVASNEAVVRGFWQAVAAEYRPPLPIEMVDTAIARAGGNVLHAVMLHDTLRDVSARPSPSDVAQGVCGEWRA